MALPKVITPAEIARLRERDARWAMIHNRSPVPPELRALSQVQFRIDPWIILRFKPWPSGG